MIKRILSVVLCLFLLMVSLTACSEKEFVPSQKSFNQKVQASELLDGEVIAQNSNFQLQYDKQYASIKLVDNAGNVWEACPRPQGEPILDDLGMEIPSSSLSQSIIEVGYMNKNISGGGTQAPDTFSNVIDGMGRVVCKKIENGVTIEYYFDEFKFMIPVDFVLKDDYLSISVDTKRIQESELKITYVALAPFICAAENDMPDSYLFYPSGSGALLSNKTISDQGFKYNAYVYGDDLTMEEQYLPTNETPIRMPVYGYKSGEKGGFAIIDKGADTAILNSVVGNSIHKFSAIYPSFQLRGYTSHVATTFSNTYNTNIYPTNMIEGTVSMRFYPLTGENANYNKMAGIYRDYLIKEKGLKENGDSKDLSVSLLGGTMITKSFLGIPYQTLKATTTISDANNIVNDLSKSYSNYTVKLKGFGDTGIDIGKVGSGFKIGGNIGSAGELENFAALCKNKKVDLYMDYELVKFNSSGSGFSNFSDVVMNSGYIRSDQFIYDRALRTNEEDLSYRLLRPIKFGEAVLKAVETNADWSVPGVSFDTLSSLSYSDYSDYNTTVAYNAKHGYSDAVSKALAQIKGNKQKYMASSANDYAAVVADVITDAPVSSDNGHSFAEDVPFYSMVFKGYVPMTCESINTAANTKKTVLGAVEGGMGLNYTLISSWDNTLIDALYPSFYSTVYSNIKDDMLNTYNSVADYYKAIDGAKIVSNTIVSKGVHCTVFDNGVTVYVNYNTGKAETPAGSINGLDFTFNKGGAAQ